MKGCIVVFVGLALLVGAFVGGVAAGTTTVASSLNTAIYAVEYNEQYVQQQCIAHLHSQQSARCTDVNQMAGWLRYTNAIHSHNQWQSPTKETSALLDADIGLGLIQDRATVDAHVVPGYAKQAAPLLTQKENQ
jgi:hypothetical protein